MHLASDNDIQIVKYSSQYLNQLLQLQKQIIAEGNESLLSNKFDPHNFEGQILLGFCQNELMSLSVVEPSHYTGDPDIACRIGRYHILQKYRNKFTFAGFRMLPLHCQWADAHNFKICYWTHNTQNRALNALYQKKRRYTLGAQNNFFEDPFFQSFKLESNMLFKVTPKTNMLQYIYTRKSDPTYIWRPQQNIIYSDLPRTQ